MKKALVLVVLALAAVAAHAQTATLYTITANCGGARDMGLAYCNATDAQNNAVVLEFDNRTASTGFAILKGTTVAQVRGPAYVFPHPTDHTPFTGTINYQASGTDPVTGLFLGVNATLNYSAKYVGSCSGRGCGSTIGWHYTVLADSQATVTQ